MRTISRQDQPKYQCLNFVLYLCSASNPTVSFKNFNNENKELLIEIARLPSKVLGFGPVKIKSIDNHYKQRNNIYSKLSKLKNLNLNAAE